MVSAQSFCTIYIHNGSIVQGIERRFPKPQIRVRVAVELQQRGCRNVKLGSPFVLILRGLLSYLYEACVVNLCGTLGCIG